MSKRGKRKWSPDATLVIPDPKIAPYDLEEVATPRRYEGLFFEVKTEEISVHTLYQFNDLVARLCDCEVMVEHLGAVWSTILLYTADVNLARAGIEDAARFYKNITWEERPREL